MTNLTDIAAKHKRQILLQDHLLSYAIQILVFETKWDEIELINTLFNNCIPVIKKMTDAEVANAVAELQDLMEKTCD